MRESVVVHVRVGKDSLQVCRVLLEQQGHTYLTAATIVAKTVDMVARSIKTDQENEERTQKEIIEDAQQPEY